ncbi:helix-turn-helix domain-containing protein [Crossiella cryophila]|uniref:DNA-binding XRE family transcriptional regulator n=1 Tax=Crossiella cryophila TaxID=43355 RepID=A0A7W7FRU1_9PSEU|nr:XRE family transcriptional regulator [Crossiella cryophila]MBB4676371.1 DNA-binding XRE family transcriptional regulator [Crossiella cryophila]
MLATTQKQRLTAVQADKEKLDRDAGRDVHAARADARRHTAAYVVGYRLAELRKEAGLTQVEVAKRMGISQARVSQVERGEVGELEVDTVHRYVTAIGGRLRLIAQLDEHEVPLSTGISA